MTKTAVGLYSEAAAAYGKIDELLAAGIRKDQLSYVASEHAARTAPAPEAAKELSGPLGKGQVSLHTLADDLASIGVPQDEADGYAEGVRRGGVLLVVQADDEAAERAVEIMHHQSVVDIEDRTASWRERGWTGYQPGAAPYTAEEAERERAEYATEQARAPETGEKKIPLAEEEVQVGKREVPRGGIRVHSRVVEQPVEEKVRLRDEEAYAERRTTDRPVRPGDEVFQERDVEVTETDEEAVVSKEARVVGEVAVGKERKEREQTVRDKVRRTEVDVEDTTAEAERARKR